MNLNMVVQEGVRIHLDHLARVREAKDALRRAEEINHATTTQVRDVPPR